MNDKTFFHCCIDSNTHSTSIINNNSIAAWKSPTKKCDCVEVAKFNEEIDDSPHTTSVCVHRDINES